MEPTHSNVTYHGNLKLGPDDTIGVCLPWALAKDGYVYVGRYLFSDKVLAALGAKENGDEGIPICFPPCPLADDRSDGNGVDGVR